MPWAPLASAVLHISEEFVWPGGFRAWYRLYRADSSRITARFLFFVNALLVVVCCNVAPLGRSMLGVADWLAIMALLCSNGIWHAWASYKSRSYSPGMVTGLFIYVPLTLYGYGRFLHSREAFVPTAIVAAIVGGSYPFWSALYHRSLHFVKKRSP